MGVAEAKRRFGELIDRVQRGERFLVRRHGRPAVALVPPTDLERRPQPRPRGLAAGAGALGDWEELPAIADEIYAGRRTAKDRPGPALD